MKLIVSGVFLVIFALQSSVVFAQDRVEVNRDDLPEKVADNIESNYLPCKESIKWYVTRGGTEADYYVATASGDQISCESVYDRNGKLIRATTEMTSVRIPPIVATSIKRQYPEWKITEEKMVFRDFDMEKKHFEVVIDKDGEKQTLYYDSRGSSLKPGQVGALQYYEIDRNRVPSTVAESIEKNFLPCKEGPKWYVTDNTTSRVDEYVVRTSGQNVNCEAVYDRQGRLLSSETILTNVKLPRAVMDRISSNYPGWSMSADKMVMRDFDDQQKIYQVTIVRARDGKKTTIYFDANGKRIIPKLSDV